MSKKENYRPWIGRTVSVTIDRPLGSRHPEFPEVIYPVNYGFIPGTRSAVDDEPIDAYVIGPTQAVQTFHGVVVGIIVRAGDEIKLVVTDGIRLSAEEIRKHTQFQEQYFSSTIIIEETSE